MTTNRLANIFKKHKKNESPEEKAERKKRKFEKNRLRSEYLEREMIKKGWEIAVEKIILPEEQELLADEEKKEAISNPLKR